MTLRIALARGSRSAHAAATILLCTGSLAVFGLAGRAVAAVGSEVSNGVLTVTGDSENDTIVVTCSKVGTVTVNGVDPDTGSALCSDITAIEVAGAGGNDRIDLRGVGPTDFTALTSVDAAGGPGDDTLFGSQFADSLEGNEGIDRLNPTGGDDTLDGGSGTDSVLLVSDADVALTDDAVTGTFGSATLTSIEAANLIENTGTSVTFDASAFSGSTAMTASSGDDVLIGGSGSDTLVGGDGSDTLRGNAGDDRLNPGPGTDDVVRGGEGVDQLAVFSDSNVTLTDSSLEGPGSASLSGIETASITGGGSDNRLIASGFSGPTTISGLGGGDVIRGGPGNDRIDGGTGRDHLYGGDGNDVLSGSGAADVLRGQGGNDRLDGGQGDDDCNGGPGTNVEASC